MPHDTVFLCADDIPTAEFGAELAIMDLRSGTYVTFNRTAAAIWKLLDRPRTADDICATLATHFRVDPAQCQADVAELLRQLEDMEVVRRAAA